jgi:hypothetical protein
MTDRLIVDHFTTNDIEPGDATESHYVIGPDGNLKFIRTVLIKGGNRALEEGDPPHAQDRDNQVLPL